MKKYFQAYKVVDTPSSFVIHTHVVVTNFVITKRWIAGEWLESKYQNSTVDPVTHLECIKLSYSKVPSSFVELSKADYLEIVKQHPSQQDNRP